jgi:superfamily II DNA or RNA helicase
VLLQAPTGVGKTLMACEVVSRFSAEEKLLWFWFAPFTGVVAQTKATLKAQTPSLLHLDVDTDRQLPKIEPGSIFVLTWQAVASKARDARVARQSGDQGMGLDDLIRAAREEGYRIGVVVDEAHHGFVKAQQSVEYFSRVLRPDYVLMMTATPRDHDVAAFAKQTGYQVGGASEWATVPRAEGVAAELLKTSVKTVRFIARSATDAELLAFEEVALSECAAMHRHLKDLLQSNGVDLVPLMLVQVPNGDEEIARAVRYLTTEVGFPPEAVRAHSASEPDPNLLAMARDPRVEVIVFKMAIATGFDAPRAFTLAALRGARDASFGVQVVGRIMRVHKLLQGRLSAVPRALRYGYVFLANTADQEGLRSAAEQINKVSEHLADAAVSTVVTYFADGAQVQVVRPGESLSLLQQTGTDGASQPATPSSQSTARQDELFASVFSEGALSPRLTHGSAGSSSALVEALDLDSAGETHHYARKPFAPSSLVSERLPTAADDIEQALVAHVDFSSVLGDRLKKRTKVTRRTEDVFSSSEPEDADSWQSVSKQLIAEKARQIAFAFEDTDRRELLKALRARFEACLVDEGHELPGGDEELTSQLELVLVRNPNLLRAAYRRLRADQVVTTAVYLPATYEAEAAWPAAKRNTHGVFPPTLNPDELAFAELLDVSHDIEWWYRNLPGAERTDNVGLYKWSGGIGFFPDFVVRVKGRTEGDGIVLVEVKGPHIRDSQGERAKAAARHSQYGRVMMVGREDKRSDFRFWRLGEDGQLFDDGKFEIIRLRHS